jgi:hypothetical protein
MEAARKEKLNAQKRWRTRQVPYVLRCSAVFLLETLDEFGVERLAPLRRVAVSQIETGAAAYNTAPVRSSAPVRASGRDRRDQIAKYGEI